MASYRLPRRSTHIRGSETFETFFRTQLAVSAIFLKQFENELLAASSLVLAASR